MNNPFEVNATVTVQELGTDSSPRTKYVIQIDQRSYLNIAPLELTVESMLVQQHHMVDLLKFLHELNKAKEELKHLGNVRHGTYVEYLGFTAVCYNPDAAITRIDGKPAVMQHWSVVASGKTNVEIVTTHDIYAALTEMHEARLQKERRQA